MQCIMAFEAARQELYPYKEERIVVEGCSKYTRNMLQEIPYCSRGSGFFGSFLVMILVNFGLLQLIQDLLDPKIRSWMA